jgi:phage/plasmid primase-like uncharacterized protein
MFDKDEINRAAAGLWPDILTSLTDIDPKVLNPRKEHPCPLCGGKTRFRYTRKTEAPFFCSHCGARDGLNLYIDYTGLPFAEALKDVANYLNMVPVERREAANQAAEVMTTFPDWYEFDMKHYLKLKEKAYIGDSSWTRINGLSVINAHTDGCDALLPLLNDKGKACDFVCIDIDGNWQTTGGNTIVPKGFYSVLGETEGKRPYIAVSPFHAAHASIYMQRMVYCVYDVDNIWDVAKQFETSPLVIVTSMDEVEEADSMKFSQLTFDSKKRVVNRKVWKPFEIKEEKAKG